MLWKRKSRTGEPADLSRWKFEFLVLWGLWIVIDRMARGVSSNLWREQATAHLVNDRRRIGAPLTPDQVENLMQDEFRQYPCGDRS